MSVHIKTLIFVIGIMLGVSVGEISDKASEVAVFAIVLAIVQFGLYFWERKRKYTSDTAGIARVFSFALITALFSFGLFIGVVRSQLVEEKINFICETTCTFEAKIISSSEAKDSYQVFNVHPIEVGKNIYDVQVRTPLYPKYKIGESLKISGKVTPPRIIFPHSDKNNNRSFDYASYLLTKNVGSEIFYPKIEVVDSEAHTVSDMLGRWKEDLIARSDMYVSAPASSLASGMLFGASSISKDLSQTFRVAGLSHIVVLSGFNIAVVISSILFVLAFLPLVLRIILASISVILFVMMTGGEVSVIRATLMAFIGLLAMLLGRAYVAKQALILSLLIIVMYEPYALLHDVSLHLSFLATAGIVYLSEPLGVILKKYFTRIKSKSLQELFVTTLSAYLATLPYVMYTFGTASVYALLANILVLPLVPISMLISFLVVVSSYISGGLASAFGFIDTLLINFMIWIGRLIEHLPFSSFSLTISFGVMCLMYVCIFVFVKYFLFKKINETRATFENGNLTDIISY